MFIANARAKINLYLHVTGKRPDGYHLLESLVVFAGGGDEISVENAQDLTLEVSGPFAEMIGNADDNLVVKAARLLRTKSETVQGARIKLVKNLPVAAGIGGGSADAAETLKLLNSLWKLDISESDLADIGLSLGADVPVCLHGKPVAMSGIGEELRPLSYFPNIYILLVNSRNTVSTADVFRRLKIPDDPPGVRIGGRSFSETIAALKEARNDLERPACEILPEIETVLSIIKDQDGCDLARMSGSGATCFGLFEEKERAQNAARRLQVSHPGWWIKTFLIGE